MPPPAVRGPLARLCTITFVSALQYSPCYELPSSWVACNLSSMTGSIAGWPLQGLCVSLSMSSVLSPAQWHCLFGLI